MGGGGWNWVEVGARFSNTHIKQNSCYFCVDRHYDRHQVFYLGFFD